MSRTSRYAFIHAKVCGAIARTFVGESYRDLLRLKSLAELSQRLFPREPSVPGPVQPVEVEARIRQASLTAMTRVLDYLRDPPALLVHAARRVEYQTVKSLARSVANGTRDEVRVWDLGPWSGFRHPAAREPEKTLKSSEYAWVLALAEKVPVPEVESRVDRAYHERFFELAGVLPSADRLPVMRRARAEVALENAVRVLRLRFFFHLDLEKSRGLLVPGSSAAVRRSLEEAFETPADSAEEWRRWRYASLLDDQLGESFRAPDPLRAEQAAARLLYRRAHQAFHQHPFTLGPLVAYFRLKDYEASMLSVAAEALHLGVPEADVLGIVSAPGGGPSASGGTQSASGGAGER